MLNWLKFALMCKAVLVALALIGVFAPAPAYAQVIYHYTYPNAYYDVYFGPYYSDPQIWYMLRLYYHTGPIVAPYAGMDWDTPCYLASCR
jgi:hypothetical protein